MVFLGCDRFLKGQSPCLMAESKGAGLLLEMSVEFNLV